MLLFRYLSLKARFLVAPLLAFIILSLVMLFGYFLIGQYQQTFLNIQKTNLPLIAQMSKMGILVTDNQQKFSQLLLDTLEDPDEEKVYLVGREILNELYEIEENLKQILEEEGDYEAQETFQLVFTEYRNALVHAIELSSVDASLAKSKLQESTLALKKVNQLFLAVSEQHAEHLQQQADQVNALLTDNQWLPFFVIGFVLLMVLVSVLFANRMSQDMQSFTDVLIGLASGKKQVEIPSTQDNYLIELEKGLTKFKQALVENDEQKMSLENALKEAHDFNNRYLTLLDVIPSAIVAFNSDTKVVVFNQVAEELFQYSAEEILGQSLSILIPEEYQAEHYRYITYFDHNKKNLPQVTFKDPIKAVNKAGNTFLVELNLAKASLSDDFIMIAAINDITERKKAEEQIWNQAHYDSLTGLPNRLFSIKTLENLIAETDIEQHKVSVYFIDLDNFKKINDIHGHEIGDEILKEASSRLKTVLPADGFVGRLGGDEFILIMASTEFDSRIKQCLESLHQLFVTPITAKGVEFTTTLSIGVATYPDCAMGVQDLLKKSDLAMYQAKQNGRNGYVVYSNELDYKISREVLLEERLKKALNRQELMVYFQPQFTLENEQSKLIGAEALVRWHDSQLGWVSPEEFVHVAEQNGLIHQLGEGVLRQSCHHLKEWIERSQNDLLTVSINFSPIQFSDGDLVNTILQVVKENALQPKNIIVEVTESVFMDETLSIVDKLLELKGYGFEISMDDFGTGYSSLSYLHKYPFDSLKIDRSFIDNCHIPGSYGQKLVSTVYAIAKAMNMNVVAEGIEEEAQLTFLQSFEEPPIIQGYLLGRPVPNDEFETQFLFHED